LFLQIISKHKINFICVRYGNVLGSRGSIVPTLVNQIRMGKKLTITNPDMTRFNITMDQALELIMRAQKGIGGEVFIPKLKAYRVEDMKDAIVELMDSKIEVEQIPIRPGEKFHEVLISKHEVRNTYDSSDDYILFDKQTQYHDIQEVKKLKKADLQDSYSSDKVNLLSKNELKDILVKQNLIQKS